MKYTNLLKELVNENHIASNNMRYFKTPYMSKNKQKLLLHNNDKGNFANREWTVNAIMDINNQNVSMIGHTIEIDYAQYCRLSISLHDADNLN